MLAAGLALSAAAAILGVAGDTGALVPLIACALAAAGLARAQVAPAIVLVALAPLLAWIGRGDTVVVLAACCLAGAGLALTRYGGARPEPAGDGALAVRAVTAIALLATGSLLLAFILLYRP